MATAEAMARPPGTPFPSGSLWIEILTILQDRHPRRKHFTSFVKRLANLKGSSDSGLGGVAKSKKNSTFKNNPYPLSGTARNNRVGSLEPSLNGHLSFATQPSVRSSEDQSAVQSKGSLPTSSDGQNYSAGKKSAAPTVSTNPGTTYSDTAQSKTGTVTTAAGAQSSHGTGGAGSTFSSPAPSVRSMTTTLTTIQSGAPANVLANQPAQGAPPSSSHQGVQFTQQLPGSSPASALPSHMVSHIGPGHPPTYNTATANNLLTDNASILTLASSSKRRRRNSLDTNASVRALAPSSIFGGSRESLPLSVLSGPVPDSGGLSAVHNRPSIGGLPATERASVYSSSGVAPNAGTINSERNSYYANPKTREGDGGSVRSGKLSHGRNDSITGSIAGVTGVPSSPLAASPREGIVSGRISRRNSGWDGEGVEEESVDAEDLDRVPTVETVATAPEK